MKEFVSCNYKKILLGIITLSLFLFILSIYQIAIGNITGFQPVQYGFGFLFFSAFNWADVMIFSLLWIILAGILLRIEKKIYFWVAYFTFWLIRACGETIYSFLQQFSPNYRPWLMYAPRALMQNTWFGHFILVRFWVVEQIFFQSIAVLSLFGLLYTLLKIIKEK